MTVVYILLCVVVSYLLGAIPSGYLLAYRLRGIDIRREGSGNIGFANVLRTAGSLAGVLTLVLDAGKGFFAVKVAAWWCAHWAGAGPESAGLFQIAAFSAVAAGNVCSVFLGFRGGKGIATCAGALLALDWEVFGASLCIWLAVVWISRYISLGSLVAAVSLPLLMYLFRRPTPLVVFMTVLAAVVAAKHAGNIKRLLAGTENRIGSRPRGNLSRLLRRYQRQRGHRRVAVVGDGGWGTALALLLNRKGEQVVLWGAFPEYIDQMERTRENVRYLPGVAIPETVVLTSDLRQALRGADAVVMAVPSRYMRKVCRAVREHLPRKAIVLSAAKGLEPRTLKRMSVVLAETLETRRVGVISGPSHAEEVARGLPTTVVVASEDHDVAFQAQAILMEDNFRVYSHDDVVGVELGGVLKNVIAIAAGISDGSGLGDNAKAALLTRGMVEIARLSRAMGGKVETSWGLSGIGDLIATSFSEFGRNLRLGRMVGQGVSVEAALASTEMVVEGVGASRAVRALAAKVGVEMPITEQVYLVLHEGKNPQEAVRDLMTRAPRTE